MYNLQTEKNRKMAKEKLGINTKHSPDAKGPSKSKYSN